MINDILNIKGLENCAFMIVDKGNYILIYTKRCEYDLYKYNINSIRRVEDSAMDIFVAYFMTDLYKMTKNIQIILNGENF
jgi:hypothetical protein